MVDIEKFLGNFFKGTKNPSLDAMKYFMNEYNNFHDEMKYIHIAGTNGKGSCVEMISNVLVKQGYKVGKFISPHLIRYNERISINGKEISNLEMSNLIEELEPKIKKYNEMNTTSITLFELETTMALLYFYRNNVDFVILETGLGGLYDCTNIINFPLVSIITSIGYDHMHILGNTLSEIAFQKAGIIKQNSNTVCFSQSKEIDNVFIDVCNKKNNNLHMLNVNNIKNYSYNNDYQFFDFKDLNNIAINLKGVKQVQNAVICIETIDVLKSLGYMVSEENLRLGLKTVIHKGRMEQINDNPCIIFDGAHNEPAIRNLQNSIDMYYRDSKRIYVVSILRSKDYEKIISLLLEDELGEFIFTSGNDASRYVSSLELYDIALKYRKNQKIYCQSLDEAISNIFHLSNDNVVFFVGSFYIYGTVIKKIATVHS